MQEFDFSASLMGCTFDVSIVCDDNTHAQALFTRLSNLGQAYENRFSRFLADSELSRLNILKKESVSDDFYNIFMMGQKLHDTTHGVFNPLVQVSTLGYTKPFQNMAATSHAHMRTPYSVSYDDLHIDHTQKRIALHPSQKVDFGGFLKGHVAQKMAEMAQGVQGIVVNIGGDICTRGTDADGQSFLFNIYNPHSKKDIPNISLTNESLSTSGIYKRVWDVAGITTHHIVHNDGTKNPHTDLLSASVISPQGALSDALATTAIVLGSQKASLFLRQQNVQYILITDSGTILKN